MKLLDIALIIVSLLLILPMALFMVLYSVSPTFRKLTDIQMMQQDAKMLGDSLSYPVKLVEKPLGIAGEAGELAPSAVIGAFVEGFILGLAGVWLLLKTGTLQTVSDEGSGLRSNSWTRRILSIIFFVPTLMGIAIIGIVKLDPAWYINSMRQFLGGIV